MVWQLDFLDLRSRILHRINQMCFMIMFNFSYCGVFCFMFGASQRRRSAKRIQVFGFYLFMEAIRDRGREATYCDKHFNRLVRSQSSFLWQRVIRRYAPLHCTVQFVTFHLTCAVRVRLTSALDRISVFGGYIHRMWVGNIYCLSSRFNTQVGVANNLSIYLCLVCVLLYWQFPSF